MSSERGGESDTTPTGVRLRWWGSDCILDGGCEGNTTPDSMRCDGCGSDQFTVPLYEASRAHWPSPSGRYRLGLSTDG